MTNLTKKSKIHETEHHCNAETLLEIQRRVDKKDYLVELYKNQLPILMLRTIEEWTSSHYLLEAVEESSPNSGCEFIYIYSQKKWASLVIHDKKTTLIYEELVDFMKYY
jgi:hypothetical protein